MMPNYAPPPPPQINLMVTEYNYRFHERFLNLETCGKGAQVTRHRNSVDFFLWG